MPPAYSIKMSQALLSLWEMLYCISSLSVIVKSWSKLLPQGAVGIGRHLGCLYGNNAVQTDALLIHLVQYGQCHMEFEYTEQGEVYMVVIPEHVSFVCPYGYTNGGFLAIEQTVNRFSSSDICCARTTVAIQVNKVSMAMKYAFITEFL